jgi:hypothetical protein
VYGDPMAPLPIRPHRIIEEQNCVLLVSFAMRTLLYVQR